MKRKARGYQNLVLISQLGIQMMVPVFLCLFIGLWLDGKFETWFTVPFLFLGIGAGARNAYLLAKNSLDKECRQDEKENLYGYQNYWRYKEKKDETHKSDSH